MHNTQMFPSQLASDNADHPIAFGGSHKASPANEDQNTRDSPKANCWTCFPYIMIKFRDPKPSVRQKAVLRLSQFHPDDVIDTLCKGLQDPSILVQMGCIMALQRILDRRAVRPLVEALRKTASETIRYTIIDVLSMIGDASIIPEITPFLADPSLTVQKSAIFALRLLRWS